MLHTFAKIRIATSDKTLSKVQKPRGGHTAFWAVKIAQRGSSSRDSIDNKAIVLNNYLTRGFLKLYTRILNFGILELVFSQI